MEKHCFPATVHDGRSSEQIVFHFGRYENIGAVGLAIAPGLRAVDRQRRVREHHQRVGLVGNRRDLLNEAFFKLEDIDFTWRPVSVAKQIEPTAGGFILRRS